MDIRVAAVSVRTKSLNRYIDKGLEDACGLVRELGEKYQNVSQGILVLDVDGFNLIQHGCLRCVGTYLRLISQYETYHPGCAERIFVVNAPAIAEFIIEPAKALMHPDTIEVLSIFLTNKKKWEEEVLKYFERNQLPPEPGGTLEYRNDVALNY